MKFGGIQVVLRAVVSQIGFARLCAFASLREMTLQCGDFSRKGAKLAEKNRKVRQYSEVLNGWRKERNQFKSSICKPIGLAPAPLMPSRTRTTSAYARRRGS